MSVGAKGKYEFQYIFPQENILNTHTLAFALCPNHRGTVAPGRKTPLSGQRKGRTASSCASHTGTESEPSNVFTAHFPQ